MNTPKDRLIWMIEFAESYDCLAELKDWQRLKFAEEIRAFVRDSLAYERFEQGRFPGVTVVVSGKSLDELTIDEEEIARLWARAFNLLSTVPDGKYVPASRVHRRLCALDLDRESFIPSVPSGLGRRLENTKADDPKLETDVRRIEERLQTFRIPFTSLVLFGNLKANRTEVHGSLLEIFSLACWRTLDTEETAFIAVCPECRRMFYRVRGRQKYCSKRCINRVSRREWLKKAKNRKKESEWAHQRYERRVRKRVGTNARVRVDRRPRSKK
jgi:hypothetical protein